MRTFVVIAILLFCCWRALPQQPEAGAVRFAVIDVVIDSGTQALAAYQLELSATNGLVKIVGIEGGDPGEFSRPPYYDPAAMQRERVVLGAFSTAANGQLPRGAVRVASVHCQILGDGKPDFQAKVTAAATSGGGRISVQINVKERSGE